MKVILLEDVKKLGKRGEIKEVSNGYARNYLIPKKLAKIALAEEIKSLKIEQEKEKEKREKELKEIGEIAKKIDGQEIEIKEKINDKGKLYSKITDKKIIKKLAEAGYNVPKKTEVELGKEIDETGEYKAKLKFEHNLESEITIIVSGKNKN